MQRGVQAVVYNHKGQLRRQGRGETDEERCSITPGQLDGWTFVVSTEETGHVHHAE